jgi:hypothetical protein
MLAVMILAVLSGSFGLLAASLVAGMVRPAFADFTEQAQFGAGNTLSVAWGDANGDERPDLAVANLDIGNWLYTNNGDGTFTGALTLGMYSTFALVWGDIDNDGDLDVGVGNSGNQQNYLYVRNGDGTYTAVAEFGRRITNALAWADYDLDGDLDMAVGNGLLGTPEQNRLFVNNGDGTFTGQTQFGLGQSASVAWGDFDNDGDPDLAVGNGGFCCVEQNRLYVNNGDGTFTERAEFGGLDTACLSWADADNDGDLDLAVGNWSNGGNLLCVNNGDGTFTLEGSFGARDTNTLAWGDADNDGDLDVAVGNGDFTSGDSSYLYLRNGDGTYAETAAFGFGSTDGVAWADYDGDGDLDLAAGNEHSPPTNYLYVNNENDDDYVMLHLVGHRHDLGPGYSNRDGIGARVELYEAGFVGDTAHRLGMREIEAHGGFSSQGNIDAHFGVPGRATVDARIVWPGSGGSRIVQFLTGLAVGQRYVVNEQGTPTGVSAGLAGTLGRDAVGNLRLSAAPNPMRTSTTITAALPSERPMTLRLVDASGRLVRTLRLGDGGIAPLRVEWDGCDHRGRQSPAGIYWALPVDAGSARPVRIVLIR